MNGSDIQQTLQQLIQEHSIIAGPIPEQQSFTFLKQEGLKEIKALAGHVWSNFNESDPGVTILDQICYALAELGYVNSFSIEDVLTQSDGKIAFEQQFFRPEEILTTAPVTIDDYRRLVLDQFQSVDIIYITPLCFHKNDNEISSGLYQTAVYSKKISKMPSGKDDTKRNETEDLLVSVHRFLNQQRNLAEYFLPPVMLKSQPISLSGQIILTRDAEPRLVVQQINKALDKFVCPGVQHQGYTQLVESGFDAGAIFNGPLLKNGWICGEHSLGAKRREVMLTDLVTLISAVSGVSAVESLEFDEYLGKKSILIEEDRIGEICLGTSFKMEKPHSMINIFSHSEDLSILSRRDESVSDVCVDLTPPLPAGEYRDIESYYSIQNTFPENYGVGVNSLQSDSPDYRIAQSRQLKGYLLFFDQVMANQFSQLANLGRFFSFKYDSNSRESALIKRYTPEDTDPQTMAIPVRSFTQSYYFQPLYNVPDVQALLLGENRYQYFYPDDPADAKLRKKIVWQRFITDSFNPYYYGLNCSIETEDDAEERRDVVLSHLMARHGEPADLYDGMIDTYQWYGGRLKTRIIIKSVWLQNLQGLSYRRNCAADFFRALPLITPGRYRWTGDNSGQARKNSLYASILESVLQDMKGRGFTDRKSFDSFLIRRLERQKESYELPHNQEPIDFKTIAESLSLEDGNQSLLEREQQLSQTLVRDGVFDLQAISDFLRFTEQNYNDFSVFELKCDLLLGISRHFQTLAITLVHLIQVPEFLSWLSASPQDGEQFPERDSATSFSDTLQDISVLKQDDSFVVKIGSQPVLILPAKANDFGEVQLQSYIDQLDWLSRVRRGNILVEETLLQPDPGSPEASDTDDFCIKCLRVTLAFPDYVVLLRQPRFIHSLRELERLHFPAHVSLLLRKGNYQQISSLISSYCIWYNRQIHKTKEPLCNVLESDTSKDGPFDMAGKKQNPQQVLGQALRALLEVADDE